MTPVEQDNDRYLTKVQETPTGELFLELPQKLIDQLGWEVGDDVEWGETRLAFTLTLSNQSKKFRDATEAFRDYDLEEPFQGSIAPKEELERAANEEYNAEHYPPPDEDTSGLPLEQGKLKLVEEIQNDDGTWNLIFDVDNEFKEWFKELQGLKRWSDKRFQKVLHEALIRAVEQGENEVENKAIFKFNNSQGALLCSGCRVILKNGYRFSDKEMAAFQGEGELEARYCNTCEAKK